LTKPLVLRLHAIAKFEISTLWGRRNATKFKYTKEVVIGTFASSSETTESTGIVRNILLVFALELWNKELHTSVIEIFSSKVDVTGSGTLV
jgi:hypothetical protein